MPSHNSIKPASVHNTLNRLERTAFAQVQAYVIMRGAEYVGRIWTHRAASGTFHAFVWDWTADNAVFTGGKATGGGYDMEQAALSGCTFEGVRIFDHSERGPTGEPAGKWATQLEARGFTVIQAL